MIIYLAAGIPAIKHDHAGASVWIEAQKFRPSLSQWGSHFLLRFRWQHSLTLGLKTQACVCSQAGRSKEQRHGTCAQSLLGLRLIRFAKCNLPSMDSYKGIQMYCDAGRCRRNHTEPMCARSQQAVCPEMKSSLSQLPWPQEI